MSNKVAYSADYANKDYISLFDRIINIKFTRKSGETFTLRSDYEPVWNGNSLYFKLCRPKPEIRIQYSQYQSTMINVDIFITNLNIIEFKDNKIKASDDTAPPVRAGNRTNLQSDIFTVKGNPIVKAEIEMGYLGDFYRWDREAPSADEQEFYYKAFLNLELPTREIRNAADLQKEQTTILDKQKLFGAQRRCTVRIEWAVQNNNPPDKVTQLHGYVGDTEPGFQPYSTITFDDRTQPDREGKITIANILEEVNDTYSTIDEVYETIREKKEGKVVVTYDKKKKKKVKTKTADTFIESKRLTYRNFFNGGQGFTAFEAFCFHLVTRRFIRPGTDVKRNALLEKAALEYALATTYPDSAIQLSEIKEDATQRLYIREKEYEPDYYVEENNVLKFSSAAPDKYKKRIAKYIDDGLIKIYIGARYTIRNLPAQRKLYDRIRKTLDTAVKRQEYMTWWDAADNLDASTKETSSVTIRTEVKIRNDIQVIKKYLLDAEKEEDGVDCYIDNDSTKEYILPLQNLSKAAPMTTASGRQIEYCPPEQITEEGFAVSANKKPLKCFAGLLEVRDAYMFGIPVLCSPAASAAFAEQQKNKSFVDFKFLNNHKAQMEWICQQWNLLYYVTNNGVYMIYDQTDTETTLMQQDYVKNQYSPFKIPAIYDITLDAIRKIKMPFVAFLNPMSKVEWNSTSAIGSMLSYYYQPEKGRNFFMVIKNEIEFSTTEDANMMQLDVVDTEHTDRSEVPAALLKQEKKQVYTEVIIVPDFEESLMDTWQKIYESPITKIPVEMLSLWPTNEENPKDTNVLDDHRVPKLSFFNSMKEWNPFIFSLSTETDEGWPVPLDVTDYGYQATDKKADKLYGKCRPDKKVHFPHIEFCLTALTNEKKKRIYMKFPIMPDAASYNNMEQSDKNYVLLYEGGSWSMELRTNLAEQFIIGAI